MSWPQLPTDNLYKFIAIAGLFLIGIGWLVPNFFAYDLNLLVIERYAKALELQRTLEFLKSVSKNLPVVQKEKFLKEYDDVILKGKQETAYLAKLEEKEKQLEALYEYIVKWSKWFLIAGINIAILGFSLWYVKLQKYQDRIIKKQAEETQNSKST